MITILIPCYNEERNLKRGVLNEVFNFLKTQDFSWEVVITDDGSSDASVEIINKEINDKPGFRIIENEHGGKPVTLYHGMKVCRGEYVLFADMDQSTPITELKKLIPYIKKYDVIIGSRGLERKNFPFYRKLGSKVFINFRKSMLLPEIKDTQCGFKLFKLEAVKKAFPLLEFFKTKKSARGWTVTSYDVELLHILKKMGHKICEVEVNWNDRDESTSKGGSIQKYFKESKSMATQIIRVKINDLRGLYDI